MGWSKYKKRLLSAVFNPGGVPGALVPRYGDYLAGADDRNHTAYHEAGHTLVNELMPGTFCISKATIRPNLRERLARTKGYIRLDADRLGDGNINSILTMMMAGKAAEQVVFGHHNDGLAGDMAGADDLLKQHLGGEYTPELGEALKATAEHKATQIITANRDKLDALADRIKHQHTLTTEEIEQTLGVSRKHGSRPPPRHSCTHDHAADAGWVAEP